MRLVSIATVLLTLASPAWAADTAPVSPAAVVSPEIGQALLVYRAPADKQTPQPYAGRFAWSQHPDKAGVPQLIGLGGIAAPSFGLDVVIHKNTDPTLPAAMLIDVGFASTALSGPIAKLEGARVTSDGVSPGGKLIGAAAHITKDSFVFALSAAPDDVAQNTKLLLSRGWLDLDVTFFDGSQGTIALETTAPVRKQLEDLIAAWKS